jgi:hypothetical protein
MNCHDVRRLLSDYIDGELGHDVRDGIEQHLGGCPDCRRELEAIRSLLANASTLPKSVAPARDLWRDIEPRLGRQKIVPGSPSIKRALAIAAVIIVGVGSYWLTRQAAEPAWRVARLEGTPRIGSTAISGTGRLRLGETLETDASSRAQIDVGVIGNVDVDPNSRIRLLRARTTDHRLALYQGTIHARIWAPPRLFFVETPSATAIDLGCEYTLSVDDRGASVLRVTSGWVALEYGGRESIVPAGAMCVTRSGYGPGTPFQDDASAELRAALESFDFENGGSGALTTVLSEARNIDSITLWHLLLRVNSDERARVYDRLAALVPAPEGVTRKGVLQGDKGMLEAWQKQLNLGMKRWWQFWR